MTQERLSLGKKGEELAIAQLKVLKYGSSPYRVGKNELIDSRKACPIKGLVVASGLGKVL